MGRAGHRGDPTGRPVLPAVAEELKAWCKEQIAAHKVPSSWFFIQAYPMTPSGKVQKFVLQDQIASGALSPVRAT